jgi:hypothetical protein
LNGEDVFTEEAQEGGKIGVSYLAVGLFFVPGAGEAEGGALAVGEAGSIGAGALDAEGAEGIYEFSSSNGLTYVGQTGNLARRIGQHIDSGKLLNQDLSSVRFTAVAGGKLAREIAEQTRINELGGIANLRNKINALSIARQLLYNVPQIP